jgi:ABC-2 type transport system permease protein
MHRWSLARFAATAELELLALWQTKTNLIGDLLVGPIVYFAFFVAGIGSAIGGGTHAYLAFVLPGFLVMQGFNGFSGSIFRSTIDRRWGLLALKRLLGAGGLGYVLALTVAPMLKLLIKTIPITAVALMMGLGLKPVPYLLAILLTCVLLTFWSAAAILLTSWVTSYARRDMLLGILLLPMTFGAPIFYSLDDAPRYLRVIAYGNPLSYQVMAVRDVFNGENPGWWLVAALVATIMMILAAVHSVTRGELLGKES